MYMQYIYDEIRWGICGHLLVVYPVSSGAAVCTRMQSGETPENDVIAQSHHETNDRTHFTVIREDERGRWTHGHHNTEGY